MESRLKVQSPFDGHTITELEWNTEAQLDRALYAASKLAANPDAALSPEDRIRILNKTADLVQENKETFARQAAEEGGKPLIDSRVELARAVDGIREAARCVPELTGRQIPMNLNEASKHRWAFTVREPIGLVAAISAFNHPFNLIVHQVIPAIAAGCPVIVKPALTTPLSCLNLLDCLKQAGLPDNWCQPMLIGNDLAEKLATDPRVDFLTFIGSAKVGWQLRSKASPGTRCALEHGGAAPVILEADANLENTLPALLKGGYYHAGQVCVSVQRVFAHQRIVERVAGELSALANQLAVGDPVDEATDVGPLILEREVDRVAEWVDEARNAGAGVISGGRRLSKTCYAPTVVLEPTDKVRLSHEEIFGPVVNVYAFNDRRTAIRRANEIPYSFQASVFTQDVDAALDAAQRLNAAAVMINDHTAFRVDWMPFAGRKVSGLGVGGIRSAMAEMTEEKLIVFKSKNL